MQCRVCRRSKCHILFDMNIPGTENGQSLYECFNECTQLDATANDGLPKTLCKICAQKLQIAYTFRRRAQQSNDEFKKLLIMPKMENHSLDSAPVELCVLEDMQASADDPLDMSFHEALKAFKQPLVEFPAEVSLKGSPSQSLEEVLKEPLVEFLKEKVSLEQTQTSPIQSLEETLKEPLMECSTKELRLNEPFKSLNHSIDETQIEIGRKYTSEIITEAQDTSLHKNHKRFKVIMSNDSKVYDSVRQDEDENETERIEKVGYVCEICKRIFVIKNDLKKHISEQHKSEVICINCSKVYDLPEELRIHKKLVHETNSPVQCDFCCEKPLLPRIELLKHFQTVHCSRYFRYFPGLRKRRDIDLDDPTSYKCKYCNKIFATGFDLENHIRSHVFKCPICCKNFNKLRTYYTHAKRLHNNYGSTYPPPALVVDDAEDKTFECKACSKTYTNLGSYDTHIKRKHKKQTETNDTQESTENQIVDIETYRTLLAKKESEESPSREDVEWKTTSKKDESYENILNSAQNNAVDQNSKELVKKDSSEKTNLQQLKEKKRYLCSFCPRELCSNVSLRSHEKTQHLNGKRDLIKECPICQKKLNMDYINRHIKTVHIGERNIVCDICGDTYKCISQLRRHKLLHTTDRQWPCSVCDMKFSEKSALQVHMRYHTGEMPFACHICDRQFRIRVHLTYHLQKHANIKKICNVCGKEFKAGTSLRKHSFEHTGNMPYKCTDCGYETVKREYITSHMLRKHNRAMTEDELFLMFKTNTGKSPRVKNAEYLKKLTENLQKSDNTN